jgi:hypothetical protein
MAFSADKFQRAAFAPRTETVEISAMAEFFGPEEKPEFTVRGLTASELHKAMEAGARNKQVDAVVKALSTSADKIAAIRAAIGLSADTPGEIAKRIEMLVAGCISPKIDHAIAVKLAEVFPVEFYDLSNRITTLTGMGSTRVKPPASSQPTPA